MLYIKNPLVLTVTVLLTVPFAFGQNEITTESTTDIRVGEEDVELVAPSLEWEVDEDTARDMCKLLYAKTYGKSTKIPWDKIQARVYPVYSHDGKRKYYLGLVYYGEGEMPDHEEMMESINEGYEASKKRTELEVTGKEVPEELIVEAGYMYGFDENHNMNYWSTNIPAITSYGTGLGLGEVLAINDVFTYYPFATDRVENKFGVSNAEVVGIICEGTSGLIKVKAGGEIYYASGSGLGGAYTPAEVAEISVKRSNKLIRKDRILDWQAEWEQYLDEIERYNSGEPIIYPEEEEGGGSKGLGIKQEYRKENDLVFSYLSRR